MKPARHRASRRRSARRTATVASPPRPAPPVLVQGHEALVGIREAATYLDLKPSLVYEWVRLHRLPSYKIGVFRKFRISELAAWLAQRRDAP